MLKARLLFISELVVIHDEQVNRTSNGYGYVINHTLKELKQLDFGKWHHKRFTSTKIPTLQEVIELLKGWNGLLNIELKNSFINYPEIEEKLLQYLYSYDLENQVIISSFNHYSLEKIKELNPNLKIGLLYEFISFSCDMNFFVIGESLAN